MGHTFSSLEQRSPTPGFPNTNWLRPVNPPTPNPESARRRSFASYLTPKRRNSLAIPPRPNSSTISVTDGETNQIRRHSVPIQFLRRTMSNSRPTIDPFDYGRRGAANTIVESPCQPPNTPAVPVGSPSDSSHPYHRQKPSLSSAPGTTTTGIPIANPKHDHDALRTSPPSTTYFDHVPHQLLPSPSFPPTRPSLLTPREDALATPRHQPPRRAARKRHHSHQSQFSSDDESNGDAQEDVDERSLYPDSPLATPHRRRHLSHPAPINTEFRASSRTSPYRLSPEQLSPDSYLTSGDGGSGESFYTGKSSSSLSSEEGGGSPYSTKKDEQDNFILPPSLPYLRSRDKRLGFFGHIPSPAATTPSLDPSNSLTPVSPFSQWSFDSPPIQPLYPSYGIPLLGPELEVRYDPRLRTPAAEEEEDVFKVHSFFNHIGRGLGSPRITEDIITPGLNIITLPSTTEMVLVLPVARRRPPLPPSPLSPSLHQTRPLNPPEADEATWFSPRLRSSPSTSHHLPRFSSMKSPSVTAGLSRMIHPPTPLPSPCLPAPTFTLPPEVQAPYPTITEQEESISSVLSGQIGRETRQRPKMAERRHSFYFHDASSESTARREAIDSDEEEILYETRKQTGDSWRLRYERQY